MRLQPPASTLTASDKEYDSLFTTDKPSSSPITVIRG